MKIGLPYRGILGLGANSTYYYLHRIHQKYREQNAEFSTCPLLLYQVDFQEINPYLPADFSTLRPILEKHLNQFAQLGISKVLIPNITLHETLDLIENPLKTCHAVDLAINYLAENNITKVTLFGTLYTMNSGYFQNKLSNKNVEIIRPDDEDQKFIDDFRKEVYDGKQSEEQVTYFQKLIEKYGEKNIVLIACTELSMFTVKNEKYCIDIAELQIDDFLK